LKLLEPKKVAPNAKSCSKVAEHNRDMPSGEQGAYIYISALVGSFLDTAGFKNTVKFHSGGFE
jgi:hypothetical protein